MLRSLIYILMSSIAFIFWGLSFKESLKKGVSSVRFYVADLWFNKRSIKFFFLMIDFQRALYVPIHR